MKFCRSRGRRGFTMMETVVSVGIAAFILSFSAYLTFFAGRNTILIHRQIMGQTSAASAAERSVSLLRNAHHFAAAPGDTPSTSLKRVLFVMPQGSTGATTQALAFDSVKGELQYFADAANVSFDAAKNPVGTPTKRFGNLKNFSMSWESEFRLKLTFSFQYSGFALYFANPGNPQYGQIITDVIAKNHYIDKGSENYGKADDPSVSPFML